MTDAELVAKIKAAYKEGRLACIRIGQLLEDKRQALGGTSRGGAPVRSRFWTWFEEQDFPFSRSTAENYLIFARDPAQYELHCERVRRRSHAKQQAFNQTKVEDVDTSPVGLTHEIYEALATLAQKRHHTVNEEAEEAVLAHLKTYQRYAFLNGVHNQNV